jgi:anti-anti-sigma factor
MLKFDMPKRLDVGNAAEIEKKLTRLIAGEKPDMLVCDFSGTDYVSSAGLRIMLLITKQMNRTGSKCVLSCMPQPVLDVFKLAGFDAILDIRDTID